MRHSVFLIYFVENQREKNANFSVIRYLKSVYCETEKLTLQPIYNCFYKINSYK